MVSGASVILPENRDWIMLTEIDFSRAFAPIRRLRNVLVGLMVGLSIKGAVVLAGGMGARDRPNP